jgi:hypothetical protein
MNRLVSVESLLFSFAAAALSLSTAACGSRSESGLSLVGPPEMSTPGEASGPAPRMHREGDTVSEGGGDSGGGVGKDPESEIPKTGGPISPSPDSFGNCPPLC